MTTYDAPFSTSDGGDAGWMVAQHDGTIVAADARMAALLHVPDAQSLAGRRWPSFLTTDSLDAYHEAQNAIDAGFRWMGYLEWRPRERPVSLRVEALTTGPDDVVVLRAWPDEREVEAEAPESDSTPEAGAPEPKAPPPPPLPLADAATDAQAQIEALQALAHIEDAGAAARAVLQAAVRSVPFDFAAVVAFEGDGLEVLATYPASMAGVDVGMRWGPPGEAERRLLETGEPSLEGNGERPFDPSSPLSRLGGFGMHSALRVPLYHGVTVAGLAAIFAAQPNAFGGEHGVRLERLVRPLGARLAVGANGPRPEASAPAEAPSMVETPEAPAPAETEPASDVESDANAEMTPSPAERLSDRFERLGELGDLVSGAAHELNNPLTAIVGYAQMLPALDGDEQSRALRTIEDEALRASQIVRHLLSFARRQRPSLLPVDLNAIVHRVVEVRRYGLDVDGIEVVLELDELPMVLGDEFQLEQVVLNLLVNAHQAMAETGGTVAIRTRVIDGRARLELDDTGPGVPAELAERIFDPFFTTREVGHGAGMGLATVYGTVTEHGGRVWVERSASHGALFVVELPLRGEPEEARPATRPTISAEDTRGAPRGHGERILVVDDEAPIRSLAREILGAFGYEPFSAATAEDALALLEAQRFEGAILDIHLPGIDGVELYERICERWPYLQHRVLFITGDADSERASSLLGEGRLPYLEKPFRMRELVEALAALLAAR
ncbi:MAG: response regulator [Dehalococcoidia bacterium]